MTQNTSLSLTDSTLTPIQSALTLQREKSELLYTALPEDAGPELIAEHDAQVNHQMLLDLNNVEQLTGAAKVFQLFRAKETEFWRSVKIAQEDPDGRPISGEYRRFEGFDDYFDYILQQWKVTAPSSVSYLRNAVVFLLPACAAGLITDPKTGEIVTPDDVLLLDEHMRQMLITVCNKVLNPKVTKGLPKPIETIGQALNIINDSGSVTEAATRLQMAGLIGESDSGNNNQFTLFTYMTPTTVFLAMALDPEQYRRLLLLLGKRALPASVESLSAITDELKAITPSVEDISNDEPSGDTAADFAGYLEGYAGQTDRNQSPPDAE